MHKMQHVVGIDEAGRGPLAGPVAVGVVSISPNFNKNFFRGIKDSKKLSEKNREMWYAKALEARKRGLLKFSVSLVSEKVIDRKGITYATRLGIERSLRALKIPKASHIFLDGGLRAPEKFSYQRTIIKGDEKKLIISLASIVAKVTRDRKMIQLSKKFPKYNFQKHKGYGTKEHMRAIKKYGPTKLHRKSFLKHLTKKA